MAYPLSVYESTIVADTTKAYFGTLARLGYGDSFEFETETTQERYTLFTLTEDALRRFPPLGRFYGVEVREDQSGWVTVTGITSADQYRTRRNELAVQVAMEKMS